LHSRKYFGISVRVVITPSPQSVEAVTADAKGQETDARPARRRCGSRTLPLVTEPSAARVFRQIRFAAAPGSTELVLVRHGESEAAVEGQPFPLVGGHGDPPLSAEGRRQAARVCARLAGEQVDAIYVTNLRRTAETAAPLAATRQLEPRVEPDLREVFLGAWEGGVYRQRVVEGDPLVVRLLDEQRWDVIPGAESSEALTARVRGAVERIAGAHPDQRIAVFAHGGVIGHLLALAAASAPFAFAGADNASISHVVVSPSGHWIIRRYNDTTHLESELTAAPESLA
jgi:2,3-bisphosphoglycerate-dependent phosphoglycerate mutase